MFSVRKSRAFEERLSEEELKCVKKRMKPTSRLRDMNGNLAGSCHVAVGGAA